MLSILDLVVISSISLVFSSFLDRTVSSLSLQIVIESYRFYELIKFNLRFCLYFFNPLCSFCSFLLDSKISSPAFLIEFDSYSSYHMIFFNMLKFLLTRLGFDF